MGALLSASHNSFSRSGAHRSNGLDRAQGLYKYSPSNEQQYFSSHYYLGHRRFETGQPELFLFGDLQDLNYLPPKPVKFPYKQPPKSQPLKTLRSFINLQRDSIKLTKVNGSPDRFRLRFTFDSDIPCQFTIFTSIADSLEVGNLTNWSGSEDHVSAVYKYGSGCEQQFTEEDHVIHPQQLIGEGYDPANHLNTIPVAVLMVTDNKDAPDSQQQALLSLCTLDTFGEDNFSIKIVKQKLLAGGMELLLQELYGLENKQKAKESIEEKDEDSDSEDDEDLGAECVICITDVKDTLLLPCRHLCLCSSCAANLRFQASNCPICRAPFRALLQIKALEPLSSDAGPDDDELTGNPKYAVPGFKCVPLLQALNGYQLEEEEEDGKKEQSATSPASTEATTEFCVIHIEDNPQQVTSEPAESPVRTLAKPLVTEKTKKANTSTVALPGIPEDHEDLTSDPQASWCGSSISSEVSVKSTDALITSAKN